MIIDYLRLKHKISLKQSEIIYHQSRNLWNSYRPPPLSQRIFNKIKFLRKYEPSKISFFRTRIFYLKMEKII